MLTSDASRSRDELIATAELPSAPTSARRARNILRHAVKGRIRPSVLDTALLLSTELVTNAVACAATPLRFEAFCDRDNTLLVEVTDTNRECPNVVDRGLHGETGRGLMMVDALADAWGARARDRGKVVWFSLRA